MGVENALSSLSSAVHLISNEKKVQERIHTAYLEHGDELKAADAVAKHYWNWHLAYALGEGGATGAVGFAGLVADVPALLAVSLRLIRQIGICYGFDMASQQEQEYLMHVLRIGSTSNVKARMESLIALKHVEQILLKLSWQKMSRDLARKEISRRSLLASTRQFAQRMGLHLTERKALQLVPVIGALVGASFNALFVNDVGRSAYMVYRRRRIAEIEGPGEVTEVWS